MLDRKYLLGLLILAALTFRAGFLAFAIPIGFLLLLGWLGLTLFEAVASFIGPALQRDLIAFRHKPKRGTARLIRHLGLDTPQAETKLTEKAKALAQAARTVSLRHPNPITGPVRLDRLALALHKALPPENGAFPLALRKAWINPEPNSFTLGGLILMLRQRLGRLLFPRLSAEADQAMAIWPILSNGRTNQSTEAEPWKMVHYNDRALYEIRATLAEAAGFDRVKVRSALLPLRAQRILHAAAATLNGSPLQARIARLANPSHSGLLKLLAENGAKWQDWMAKEGAKAKVREVGASYRADGSLTQDEITALIADRAQDSILLNRVWPVGAPVTTNSWLGGLPCLPPDMDWPRNKRTGLPQHFLAQVDCAELPTLNGTSPLPRDGLLLFFSDLDEERLAESDAVVYVPKSRQSAPPRALPDDLPEINHSSGKPASHADTPGQRHYPKWPVVPTAVKIWGAEEDAHPKTFNQGYLEQSRAAHDASLAAVMPPPAESTRLGDLYPSRQRKDAQGKTILTPEGKAIPYVVFDPTALPQGFPFCGAGIEAFVDRLQQQATKAARKAATDRSYIDSKWNDTEEKRARKRAEADQADDHARTLAAFAKSAREVLGTLPALAPVPQDRIARLQGWLEGLVDRTRYQQQEVQTALRGSLLDLARASVTDPGLASRLPASVFAAHATWLLPSPRHAQHLMLGPAQAKTNSTAGGGVRLLCLDSDYGPGMMFCDCGVLEYWIRPEDLAALRFDKAYANTAGG